jgi:hypothetical protein
VGYGTDSLPAPTYRYYLTFSHFSLYAFTMNTAESAPVRVGLTDQEKGIIFGVVLGTFLSLFIDALKRQVTTPVEVITRVTEGRQSAYRYEIR